MENQSSSRKTYSTHGCRVKEVPFDVHEKPFVFSLKFDDGKLVFAAEDADEYQKWITYFRQFIKRPSLAKAKHMRFSNVSDIPTSQDTSIPLVFDSNKLALAIDNAIRVSHGAQAQFALADLCTEFLSIVHKHVEAKVSEGSPVDSLAGITITKINASERLHFTRLMKGSKEIMKQNIDGIYCPLQCIVDALDGNSYFASTDVEEQRRPVLSDSSKAKIKLFRIMFREEEGKEIKYTQDRSGRLWITDASMLITERQCSSESIAERLEGSFACDFPTLGETMKAYGARISQLSEISGLCKKYEMQQLCKCEMVARCCKSLYAEHQRNKEEPFVFFNKVLGNSAESNDIAQKIDKLMKERFNAEPVRDIHKPLLFAALQFHLGVDFVDKLDFDFDAPEPIDKSHILCCHSVLRHNFFEICNSVKGKNHQIGNLMREHQYKKVIKVLNHKITLYQTLYGEQNPYIMRDMALLSLAEMESGDMETAKLCYQSVAFRTQTIAHAFSLPVTLTSTNASDLLSQGSSIITTLFGPRTELESHFTSLLSRTLAKLGDFSAAIRLADTAISLKSFEDSLLNKATIAYYMHQLPLAFDILKSISSPTSSSYFYLFAKLLYSTKQFTSAIAYSIKAYNIRMRLFAGERVLYQSVQQIAEIYEALGEFSTSLVFYQKLLDYIVTINTPVIPSIIILMQNIIRVYCKEHNIPIEKTEEKIDTETVRTLMSSDPLEFASENESKLAVVLQTEADVILEMYKCM